MEFSSFRDSLASITSNISFPYALLTLFLLLNIKNLPFVFHIRCFNALIKHLYRSPHKWNPQTTGPAALFQPIITSSRAPFLEIDYNIHKSSSTYFTDCDASRLHLLACLLNQGIKTLQNPKIPVYGPDGKKVKGGFGFVLGAVQCSYRREIKPYESYEMWSRVLGWDRKWLYIVTHFVKKGAVRPAGYTLTDGSLLGRIFGNRREKKSSPKKRMEEKVNGSTANSGANAKDVAAVAPQLPHKAICASAISKYVFKKGRLTLHPEVMLEASGLLPARPGGWNTFPGLRPSAAEAAKTESSGAATAASMNGQSKAAGGDSQVNGWDWKRVEEENQRGLKMAEHFAALEGLHDVFTGGEREALGVYRDLLW